MTNKKKNVALYVIIAVLVIAILAIIFLPSIVVKNNIKYDTVDVVKGNVFKYVTATSNAIVKEQKVHTAISNGEVKNIKFKEGDFVKEDSVVMTVGSVNYRTDFDGYLTFINVEEGDEVAQGAQLFTVTDNSSYSTVLGINEVSYPYLKKGNIAEINFNAVPDVTFNGKIKKISSDGKITNGATLFDVYIDIEPSEGYDLLRNNMTCEVKIIADERRDVLVIPVKAITYDGDKPYVTTYDGNNYVQTEIQIGMSDGIIVEVVDGLKLNDTVYYIKDKNSRMAQMMEMWGM